MSLCPGEQTARTRWRPGAAKGRIDPPSSVDSGPDRARGTVEAIKGAVVFLGFLLLFLLKAPGLGFFISSQDHGYQLSIGTQVLLGKVPGIDLIIAYGPMVMYTSALGLWLTGSLIGETILCSTGYALSLFLLYHLVSRYASKRVGLVAAGFGFVLQARFYKWYVWLIPMAILWVWHRYLSCPPAGRRRWVVAGGSILGICWLYRPDFGTTELAACLVFLGLIEAGERPRDPARALRTMGLLLAGFSVFPLAWFGYLAARVGPLAPLTYLVTTVQATLAICTGMSQPPPPFRSVIVGYGLIPASYLFAFVAVWRRALAGRLDARSWFLLASALVGMGSLHQAMHRMDPGHLLQVVPPAIVCASLLASGLLGGAEGFRLPARAKPWIRLAGVGYATLLVAIGLKLSHWGQVDLEAFSAWPLERYNSLADPLGHSGRDPRATALSTVTKLTKHGDPILVFPLDCQFYALTQRRISGRLHAYYAGVFDSPQYRARNLEAIQAEMPQLVVVPSEFESGPEKTVDVYVRASRRAHQYLERFIRQNYTRVVLNDGGIMVLSR
ncbi:MAG: hypothetical protein ACHRXM_35940 [Isosphaerales bacterium]